MHRKVVLYERQVTTIVFLGFLIAFISFPYWFWETY